MTAFPLQKTMAAVIAVANAPESAHGFYKTSALDLAKTLGYEPDKLMKIGYGTRPVVTTHESVVSPLEYPTKLANASYSGISHNGSGRSKMDRDSYVETVQRLYDEAIEKVETEAQRAAVLEAVDKFKREYLKRERQVISVRSNTYSGYVAGRSKLNARQANAGNDRLSKAQSDFYDWIKRASPSIMRAVMDSRSPEQIEAARMAAEEKRITKERQFDDVMVRLLNFRDGDDFVLGKFQVAKVGKSREGIPKNVTFKAGQGLVGNKMDLVGARSLWPTEEALKASYDRAMASGQVVERESPKAKPKKAAKADEAPPPGALTMTMDEWKKIHRDFKSIIDGQRMAIRDGILKQVYIVKGTPKNDQGTVYYHGSDSATPVSGSFTYLTPEKSVASTYGKQVLAFTADVSKTLDLTDMKTARTVFDDVFPDIEDENLAPVGVMIAVRYGEDEIREWAQSRGYDSILLPTTKSMDSMELAAKPALIVFDPKKLKPVSAGFDSIDAAAHEAATSPRNYQPEPSDGQKIAGSYKMGRIRISGVDIAIENPQGSIRSGIGFDGQRWANTMQHHYGYINGSTGADGDHIDVFVQPGLSEDYDGPVYVIDQIDPETGDFDEHKVIIGATSMQQAKAMYLSNYDAGWQGCGDVTMMTWPEFREWIASGDTTGPVGEAIESGYDSATGWIGVDLDGTLAKYKGWKGNQNIGSPVAKMVGRVKSWLKAGKDVRIFTARAENKAAVPQIEAWCQKVFGQKLPVTNKKDSGMVQLWDDRAVSVETNTGRAVTGFDDIRIGGGLSTLLEAITGFDGGQAQAVSLAAMLGIRIKDLEWDKFRDELLTGTPGGGEVDLFGDPIMPPEDMGGDLFGDEPAPQHMPIEEIPVHEIDLSADVPQFKSGADDETGVVEPLGGKFDRTGVAPIQLWKRRDGRYEVISGRHRLDLARRSGEKTIPSQVHHEDRGFDARRAAMLDAELNIRDGQGKVRDYIDYFTHSGITEADAEAKGLIARHIGQRAFAIATQGSEDLIAAHKAEIISDQAAADIAGLAPGNAAMQAVGIRAIQEGKPIQTAVNTMRAVMALARESGQVADTMDLFGFDDSALREAEAMAKLASRKQRQVSEQLAAIKGAAKRPELARKQGVAVDDPEAVRSRVIELTALKQRWDNWSSHSDLLAEIRAEISKPGFDSIHADDHEATDDGYWFWMESLAA